MSPTPLAAALVAASGLLALASPWAGIPLAVIVVALTVQDALKVRTPPEGARFAPPLLSRGVPDVIRVDIRAEGSLELAQPAVAGLAVGPLTLMDEGVWQASITATRRGRHRLPPVEVRLIGPWRLGAWTHEVGAPVDIAVYPDLPAARRLARALRSEAVDAAGATVSGPLGLGTDFEALRDYRPDDDVRMVNWKATGHYGRPMSNTYRVEQSRRVLLALDCGRLMAAPSPRGGTRLDAAVDAAAALAMAADAVGDRVGLVAYDDGVRAAVRPHVRSGDAVLRALADLEPRVVDSDLTSAVPVRELLGRGARATVVVLTELFDEAAARGLVAALPALTSRHAVIVISAVDSELENILRTPPEHYRDAAVMAAAADLAEARARARSLITRTGARVVEAAPDQLSAAAVAAYRQVKARVPA
ncbi:MAG TPA: DUF58 domain-containing protein [Mycobacteriales bacterium]|nr:DUF58 domain-containing protein [Mycobacteriales bacterium]